MNANLNTSQTVSNRQAGSRQTIYYLGQAMLYLGLIILGGIIIWLGIKATRVYGSYQRLNQHVETLEAVRVDFDLLQARAGLRGVSQELEILTGEAAPFLPLASYLGWVPTYGADLKALPELAALAGHMGQSGAVFDEALSPVFEALEGEQQADPLPALVAGLVEVEPQLSTLAAALQNDQLALEKLDEQTLSPALAHRVEQAKEYLPFLITGIQLTKRLPTMLGATSPRTYLIITQSSDELRPTGGYINAAGHITLDQGRIVEFTMQDSYNVDQLSNDYPYPPDPIYKYMGSDYWVLRDANWSPDFPTSARTAMALYEMGQGITTDGVVALDQQGLAYILKSVEPLNVEGNEVTGDNLIPLMQAQWGPEPGQELDEEWWRNRKSFMLTLATTLKQKFEQELGSVNLPVLAAVLQEALAEKHILVYLTDPVVSDFLSTENWTGSIVPTTGDYMMVVDANLGFNKASAIVERRTTHQVILNEDGSAEVYLNLVYHHPAPRRADACLHDPRYDPTYQQNMERCYWNYVRLLVPVGAELAGGPRVIVDGEYLLRGLSTTGEIDVALLEPGKVSWGQLFLLAPQESISLDYIYRLPPDTVQRKPDNSWLYTLYLQKQPGTMQNPVDLTVILPENAQLEEASPAPTQQEEGTLRFQLDQKIDRQISITYRMP